MRLYECVIIARQDVSSGHVEELLNEFCAIIENVKNILTTPRVIRLCIGMVI